MGTLLHLSDLHLAGPSAGSDVIGDYKIDAVRPGDRQRRTSVIGHTLEQLGLALTAAEVRLDAIVITGDITAQEARTASTYCLRCSPDSVTHCHLQTAF